MSALGLFLLITGGGVSYAAGIHGRPWLLPVAFGMTLLGGWMVQP